MCLEKIDKRENKNIHNTWSHRSVARAYAGSQIAGNSSIEREI